MTSNKQIQVKVSRVALFNMMLIVSCGHVYFHHKAVVFSHWHYMLVNKGRNPGESIRQSDLIGSDRIHVGIQLDLMEISIKPTKSWSNPDCGPTFGTLVSD